MMNMMIIVDVGVRIIKMQLIRPIYHDHHENCPECNALDSLEIYDSFNNSHDYLQILNTHDISDINGKPMRYLKCNKCGSIFKIDWTGCVPVPLTDIKVSEFINNNNKLKNKE